MKELYLLSVIDLDTGEKSPSAIFSSKKELEAGIKRLEKDIKCEVEEGKDYEINEFYLNNYF